MGGSAGQAVSMLEGSRYALPLNATDMFSTYCRCYCGNDFALGDNTFLPDSYCATSCPGSSKELCGSQISISVFNLTNYAAEGSSGLKSGSSKSVCAETPRAVLLKPFVNSSYGTAQFRCHSGCRSVERHPSFHQRLKWFLNAFLTVIGKASSTSVIEMWVSTFIDGDMLY